MMVFATPLPGGRGRGRVRRYLTWRSAPTLTLTLTLIVVTLLAVLIFILLLSQRGFMRWTSKSSRTALSEGLQGVLQSYAAQVVVVNASTHPHLFSPVVSKPQDMPLPMANSLIMQFTHCPLAPNPYTSHIRLPNVLYNISLVSPPHAPEHRERSESSSEKSSNDDADTQGKETKTRFFNPAIIALPHWSGRVKYVLVSRLVTTGFHQESHICLADICHPPLQQSSPLPHSVSRSFPLERSSNNATSTALLHLAGGPADADPAAPQRLERRQRQPRSQQALSPGPDTSPCSSFDLSDSRLGAHGGLRCLTTPRKINIPPTPAENCTDSWLAFPDIPGFHDPRVFWSGKGEPLILVNSASRYGCVGLWIVDLRKVYPELEGVLDREHHNHHQAIDGAKVKARDTETGLQTEEDQARRGTVHRGSLGVKPLMSYPHLTEITRNPRESRARVEKNWMLWFPSAGEAYVQYNLISQQGTGEAEEEEGFKNEMEMLARLGLNNATTNALLRLATNNATNHTAAFSTTLHHTSSSRRWTEERRQTDKKGRGRTFAKLTGNGFTTPNLTSALEKPCFSEKEGHFTDSLGNSGHWHQGSNSLRLILCTRAQARSGDSACKDDESASANGTAVTIGRSVHFAIMHRKFSNELDLPLRYERYVVVWEGREPFQMLGVSRFPLLMRNEKAGPWTEEENWPHQPKEKGWNATKEHVLHEKKGGRVVRRGDEELYGNEAEQEDDDFVKSQAYFTYTPSLAWAWRPHSAAANQEEEDDDVEYMSQLGTGYLGDDVLIGIGLEDVSQAFARVKVDDLLQCLRLCPGVKVADEAS
ncbi:uncharacterized protein Z520_07585 [Fonsecaea multimorphosa CBS 102226]|uniref:Uncharacterized protein n=1 Tax=Fonsecaea multimorphosa CBS 102226 TaxID=1442371 RepID=A0A0D2H4W8_9EURO|nr:uncharacterized protein Z520_07585 [Fonsecaea multimorphosa CBS 102226]KIX96865.1 hypothetical protein Z520_07585 [Fonsecaea multimorphosa CBS 102226]OAL22543.1 hypothetical protein AYO22_07101 [Fonsecaea multimorphosa]